MSRLTLVSRLLEPRGLQAGENIIPSRFNQILTERLTVDLACVQILDFNTFY